MFFGVKTLPKGRHSATLFPVMGFYATDEYRTLARTPEPDVFLNPLRGPKRRVESGHRFYDPGLGRWIDRDPITELLKHNDNEIMKLFLIHIGILDQDVLSSRIAGQDILDGLSYRSIVLNNETLSSLLEGYIEDLKVLTHRKIDIDVYLFTKNGPICRTDYLGLADVKIVKIPGTKLSVPSDDCDCIESAVKGYVDRQNGQGAPENALADCLDICNCFFGPLGNLAITTCIGRCEDGNLHKFY